MDNAPPDPDELARELERFPNTGRFLMGRLRAAMSDEERAELEAMVERTEWLDRPTRIVARGAAPRQSTILIEGFMLRTLDADGKRHAVSLHVPGGEGTANLVGRRELALMHPGSYLLNLSRGSVVDLEALRDALREGLLAGAALDVFPDEPPGNLDRYSTILAGLENVILTPHIGGSTEEAQANIGREVSEALIAYLDRGDTQGAVNFPRSSFSETISVRDMSRL